MAAMGPPGGGRNPICSRTQSRFNLINLTFPADAQVVKIFDSILGSKFHEYDSEIKALSTGIASATLNVYKTVSAEFLATPQKFHYLFNLRDVAKVVQGILMANKQSVYSVDGMLRLWVHECQRVFSDRFVRGKSNDEQKFVDILTAKMTETFQGDWGAVMADCQNPKTGPLFCALLNEPIEDSEKGTAEYFYEELTDIKKARVLVEEKLEDYN